MHRSRTAPAVLVAVVLALTASACTARIVDPSATDPVPTAGESSSGPSSPTPSPPAADEKETPTTSSAPEGWDVEHGPHRAQLVDAATTTMPCPTAPLDQDGMIIRIEGGCDAVTIDIDAGAVILDDVGTLILRGSGSVIYADSIDAIRVSGSANEISWLGQTPQVGDTGTANVLGRG